MNSEIEVTFITCPQDDAEKIASALVDERLAACVNIIPQVTSIYRWKGSVEKSAESLLIVKSTAGRRERLEERVLELHPYSCPEIITLAVNAGFGEYLSWIASETSSGRERNE